MWSRSTKDVVDDSESTEGLEQREGCDELVLAVEADATLVIIRKMCHGRREQGSYARRYAISSHANCEWEPTISSIANPQNASIAHSDLDYMQKVTQSAPFRHYILLLLAIRIRPSSTF